MEIETAMEIMFDPNFQCHKCINKYSDRQDAKLMLGKMKTIKGCVKISEMPRYTIKSNLAKYKINYYKCIGNFYSPNFYYWSELESSYTKGMHVFPGPITEWPSKAMEIFQTISAKNDDRKKEHAKEAELKELRRLRDGKRNSR